MTKQQENSQSYLSNRCRRNSVKSKLNGHTEKLMLFASRDRNGIFNLNEASNELKVQKRRIYDVINIMQGAGAIKRLSRCQVQWLGLKSYKEEALLEEQEDLHNDITELENMNLQLDNHFYTLDLLQGEFFADMEVENYMYIDEQQLLDNAGLGFDENLCIIQQPQGKDLNYAQQENMDTPSQNSSQTPSRQLTITGPAGNTYVQKLQRVFSQWEID